jgi:hypothetical protein
MRKGCDQRSKFSSEQTSKENLEEEESVLRLRLFSSSRLRVSMAKMLSLRPLVSTTILHTRSHRLSQWNLPEDD